MASISNLPEQYGNEAPTPQLVISRDDNGAISKIAYLPGGRLVTGSESGAVRVWNLQSGEQEGTSMDHKNEVWGLAVTRDGAKIISIDEEGGVKVWDVESHELVKTWTHLHRKRDPEVAISAGDLIAVYHWMFWTVGIYTTEGELRGNSIEVGGCIRSASFSPDGSKLACGAADNIFVYDVETGALIFGPLRGHRHWVWSVLWSRDGSRLFSASRDSTIRCWNSNTGEQVGQPWTGHTDKILSLSLSPDGTLLASASWDGTIRFWNTAHGRPFGQHLQHGANVISVCFSPFGEFVASGDDKGNVYLWRVPQVSSIHHRVITPFMCIFSLIFIVSQLILGFPDVCHSRFCSHTPLILCIAPSRAPSWNRTCTTWLWSFVCEYSLNNAIV